MLAPIDSIHARRLHANERQRDDQTQDAIERPSGSSNNRQNRRQLTTANVGGGDKTNQFKCSFCPKRYLNENDVSTLLLHNYELVLTTLRLIFVVCVSAASP